MSLDTAETEAPSAAERIAGLLRDRILEGELPPGSPLREVSLATDLQVSRNTLREGLRQLSLEGLVALVPNRGAAVRRLTAADVRDIYRARRALEVQAATASALVEDEQFADMEAAVIAGERAERERAWAAASTASLRFHQALIALLGSRRLDDFFHSLLAQLRLAWGETQDEELFQRSWAVRDRELLDLLRTGHRTQGVGALLVYLDDSESQTLDTLRRARTA
ncbi:GntR family transcriptional regulator [Actinomadura sp. KC216]|uniref:GntR family transcriptional regulator n=1 Tax=Actinomadura sp. KC216 TaxID=2530370 RepID=UPI00105327E3|nr:GntR family transcriptional regulator [Actinomadura sp. KC216]TDB91100.1 GntR family transcriptional regulator [Actinomadura sp. KC216]